MLRGRVPTAEVEEASAVVVLAVVAMSAAGAAARGQLEAEAVSVAVELASVERASPVDARISQAELACQRVRPPVFSRPGRITNSRPALSNVARNRGAISSSARPSRTVSQRGLNVNGRTDHIAERHDSNWHGDWDRRHAHFDHGHFFVFVGGFWCGLDAGFFPWDYLPYYADDYYPYDYYTADVPQYDNENTEAVDNGVPVADPTVQAVQTQLTQLGYYNGPADGFFGPATRDAVAKYQIARNLSVTGSLSPDMLQSLGLPQATGS